MTDLELVDLEKKAFEAEIKEAATQQPPPISRALISLIDQKPERSPSHEEIVAKHNRLVDEYNKQVEADRLQYEAEYGLIYRVHQDLMRQIMVPYLNNLKTEILAIITPPKVSFWTKVKKFFGVK